MKAGAEKRHSLTRKILRAAIEVHRTLGGPGLPDTIYQDAVCSELQFNEIPFRRWVPMPVKYKCETLSETLLIPIVVCGRVVLEIKSVERLELLHEAQLMTYLRLSGIRVGLLINFNVCCLKDGIRRRAL